MNAPRKSSLHCSQKGAHLGLGTPVPALVSFQCAAIGPRCGKAESPAAVSQKYPDSTIAAHQSSAPNTSKPPPLVKASESVSVDEMAAKQAIGNADFDEPMTEILAKKLSGLEVMEAACKDSLRKDPVEIETTVFGDLDGDGNEEAAVTAFSSQVGQAGPDLFAVFEQQKSGEIVELPLEKAKDVAQLKGTSLPQNLGGPWRIEIDNGRLIVRYWLWGTDAPKCGDADCNSDFIDRWDGQRLALTDITQSPVK